jgi:hypothetical protein
MNSRGAGLTETEHPLFEGQYAPDLNLALFSSVLMEPQADWPANTVHTGFPFFDKNDNQPPDIDLLRFLVAVQRRLFSHSVLRRSPCRRFFTREYCGCEAFEAPRGVARRQRSNRPTERLPEDIIAVNYAPFGELLPRQQ